jgi:hypothetical protein
MILHGEDVISDSDKVNHEYLLGLWYDPERLLIEGVYRDELTAYRVRKRWISAFREHFLLDDGLDLSFKVRKVGSSGFCKLNCYFISACGRYAFWRLTHHQALEVQWLLERAHLSSARDSATRDLYDSDDAHLGESTVPRYLTTEDLGADEPRGAVSRIVRALQSIANRLSEIRR